MVKLNSFSSKISSQLITYSSLLVAIVFILLTPRSLLLAQNTAKTQAITVSASPFTVFQNIKIQPIQAYLRITQPKKRRQIQFVFYEDQIGLVYGFLILISLGAVGGILAFFGVLSLKARLNQAEPWGNTEEKFSSKSAKTIQELTHTIEELEGQLQSLHRNTSPYLIDLGILNCLRIQGPSPLTDLILALQCEQQLLQERLCVLMEEDLVILDNSDRQNPLYQLR